jgi:hypothetical protein
MFWHEGHNKSIKGTDSTAAIDIFVPALKYVTFCRIPHWAKPLNYKKLKSLLPLFFCLAHWLLYNTSSRNVPATNNRQNRIKFPEVKIFKVFP